MTVVSPSTKSRRRPGAIIWSRSASWRVVRAEAGVDDAHQHPGADVAGIVQGGQVELVDLSAREPVVDRGALTALGRRRWSAGFATDPPVGVAGSETKVVSIGLFDPIPGTLGLVDGVDALDELGFRQRFESSRRHPNGGAIQPARDRDADARFGLRAIEDNDRSPADRDSRPAATLRPGRGARGLRGSSDASARAKPAARSRGSCSPLSRNVTHTATARCGLGARDRDQARIELRERGHRPMGLGGEANAEQHPAQRFRIRRAIILRRSLQETPHEDPHDSPTAAAANLPVARAPPRRAVRAARARPPRPDLPRDPGRPRTSPRARARLGRLTHSSPSAPPFATRRDAAPPSARC